MPRKKSSKLSKNDGEVAFETLLAKSNLPYQYNDAKTRDELTGWDYQVMGLKCEVKHDLMEATTGNVAIEYFNNKSIRPSGLTATTSDVWVMVLDSPRRIYATSVKRLKQFFDREIGRDIMAAGDGNAVIRLYATNRILPIFQELKDEVGDVLVKIAS